MPHADAQRITDRRPRTPLHTTTPALFSSVTSIIIFVCALISLLAHFQLVPHHAPRAFHFLLSRESSRNPRSAHFPIRAHSSIKTPVPPSANVCTATTPAMPIKTPSHILNHPLRIECGAPDSIHTTTPLPSRTRPGPKLRINFYLQKMHHTFFAPRFETRIPSWHSLDCVSGV